MSRPRTGDTDTNVNGLNVWGRETKTMDVNEIQSFKAIRSSLLMIGQVRFDSFENKNDAERCSSFLDSLKKSSKSIQSQTSSDQISFSPSYCRSLLSRKEKRDESLLFALKRLFAVRLDVIRN